MEARKHNSRGPHVVNTGWIVIPQISKRPLPSSSLITLPFITPGQIAILPSASSTLDETFDLVKQIDDHGASQQAHLYRFHHWLYVIVHPDQTSQTLIRHWKYIVNNSHASKHVRPDSKEPDGMRETRMVSALLACYWIRYLSINAPASTNTPEDQVQEGFYTIKKLSRLRTGVLNCEAKMLRLFSQLGRFTHTSNQMAAIADHIDMNEGSANDHTVVVEPSAASSSSSGHEEALDERKENNENKTKQAKRRKKTTTTKVKKVLTAKEIVEGPDEGGYYKVSVVGGAHNRRKTSDEIKEMLNGSDLLAAYIPKKNNEDGEHGGASTSPPEEEKTEVSDPGKSLSSTTVSTANLPLRISTSTAAMRDAQSQSVASPTTAREKRLLARHQQPSDKAHGIVDVEQEQKGGASTSAREEKKTEVSDPEKSLSPTTTTTAHFPPPIPTSTAAMCDDQSTSAAPPTITSAQRSLARHQQPADKAKRILHIKYLGGLPHIEQKTNFLTDNAIMFFLEILNHHNEQDDQLHHAYCIDSLLVTKASTGDRCELRLAGPARYVLLPRNTERNHWWLDIYDRQRHVIYRLDSLNMDHTSDPLRAAVWPANPPEVKKLNVPQQADGFSCGDYVIQFATVVAQPGWHPNNGTLSRVLPLDRKLLKNRLQSVNWATRRPSPNLAPSKREQELINENAALRKENEELKRQQRSSVEISQPIEETGPSPLLNRQPIERPVERKLAYEEDADTKSETHTMNSDDDSGYDPTASPSPPRESISSPLPSTPLMNEGCAHTELPLTPSPPPLRLSSSQAWTETQSSSVSSNAQQSSPDTPMVSSVLSSPIPSSPLDTPVSTDLLSDASSPSSSSSMSPAQSHSDVSVIRSLHFDEALDVNPALTQPASSLQTSAALDLPSSLPMFASRLFKCARRGKPSSKCASFGCGQDVGDKRGGGQCDCCKQWFHSDHPSSTTCEAGDVPWYCDGCAPAKHVRPSRKRRLPSTFNGHPALKRPSI